MLVPLPTAAADHQTHNARALADAGGAVVLVERDLSPASLARVITDLFADRSRLTTLAAQARRRGRPNAAQEVVSQILTLG